MKDRDTLAGRRGADGLGSTTDTSGMPWWVRAIAYIGVPSAMAIYLVYFLANNVSAQQTNISTALATHVLESRVAAEQLKVLEQEHRTSNTHVERLLEILCLQGAKTTTDRRDCVNSGAK